MTDQDNCSGLSIFKPRGGSMRSEVRVIRLVLAGWLISILGFQFFIYLLEVNYSELLLNELTFFNLPIHFWLTGQFLPLWFIILCTLFNFWMDRHSGRSLDGSLRFMVPGARRGEGE
jgi:putative solute:sodium symporter small subunit